MDNDLEMLKIALDGGGNPAPSPVRYDGTALIAAAHLGHVEAVKMLIAAKAPLNHVNNLGWTALIEAVVLGNGGADHTATVEALVEGRRRRQHRRPSAHDRPRPCPQARLFADRENYRTCRRILTMTTKGRT